MTHRRPSELENPRTVGHFTDARNHYNQFRQQHADQWRAINQARQQYRRNIGRDFTDRTQRFRNFYRDPHYHYYYSGWYDHGFYGGFYYPVRTVSDISDYFYYPTVYWLYNEDVDNDYNQDWYGSDYQPYQAFDYPGVFYPTDTIRDLAVEIAGLPYNVQANFRSALNIFVAKLQDAVNDNLQTAITFDRGDITVDHYQNLDNQALVLEGFVDNGSTSLAFKALVDLNNPDQTIVFVPASQDPTADDLAALDAMNQRIIALGGDPMTADDEPQN